MNNKKKRLNLTKITVSLASFPEREKCLKDTVKSILPQVDKLQIYLNNYENIPKILNNEKIKVYKSQDEIGDLTDAGKFYKAEKIKGYHLTIDDDIIYPPNYVKEIIKWIEFYKRKSIVSFHGRVYGKLPINSYRASITPYYVGFSCLKNVEKTQVIDISGTGVMGYHTSTIQFCINDFLMRNMADIWVAIKCYKNNIPIYVIPHNKGYIESNNNKLYRKGTIAYKYSTNEKLKKESDFHTEIVNNYLKNNEWEYSDIIKKISSKNLPILQSKNKIAIICPMWQRQELTDIVFSYYHYLQKLLQKEIDIILCAVGSEGKISQNIAKNNNWNYIEHPNFPLNEKMNSVLLLAKKFKPDAVIVIGSDDFLNKNLFYFYDNLINNKIKLSGFTDAYVIDKTQNKLIHWDGYPDKLRKNMTTGLGRFYSNEILQQLNWNLWGNIPKNRSLDTTSDKMLNKHNLQFSIYKLSDVNGFMVDIKDVNNLTTFKSIYNCSTTKVIENKESQKLLKKYLGIYYFDKITKYIENENINNKSDSKLEIQKETIKDSKSMLKFKKNPLINILIRTSNRPNYFKNCIECIRMQTYQNVNLIVSVDDDFTQQYVKAEGLDCLRFGVIPKSDKNHSPYNLFLNTMLTKVKDGFILFMDDDDYFPHKYALETIVNEIYTQNDLIIWQVETYDNYKIPNAQLFGQIPTEGNISGSNFLFHTKYKDTIKWDDRHDSNFKVFNALYHKIPHTTWIQKTLVKMGNNGAGGDRVDI